MDAASYVRNPYRNYRTSFKVNGSDPVVMAFADLASPRVFKLPASRGKKGGLLGGGVRKAQALLKALGI